ncbi:MAG: MFS transporter [Chloroflexi bacterium]|nr:MFS transporter [Chloroflexota bacterium]
MKRLFNFHYGWVIVFVSFTVLFIGTGTRNTFGIYFKPMITEFGWDRASAALAVSISQLVYGIAQPLVGKAVDQFGTRRVVIVSTLAAGIGTALIATTSELWQLYLTFGILAAIGSGGTAFTTFAVLVSGWFSKRRGLALGLSQAGFPAAQVLLIPVSMYLIITFNWRISYVVLAAMYVAVALPLTILFLKADPAEMNLRPYGADDTLSAPDAAKSAGARRPEKRATLTGAMKTASFWQLAFGFFVCGFSVSMVTTHLVTFASDVGISEVDAANALALMGGLNVFGTMLVGGLTDRLGKKNPLAFIYFTRGISFLILLSTTNASTLYLFTVVFGFAYLATVPPTSGLSADLYGRASMGTIFGTISLSHQIGGALGAYLAGAFFDASGTYYYAYVLGAISCFAAAAASYAIREKRATQPLPAGA